VDLCIGSRRLHAYFSASICERLGIGDREKERNREREKYKETHISCLGEREAVCKRVLCDVLIYLQSYTTLLQSSA
jgi:hypothetical protein